MAVKNRNTVQKDIVARIVMDSCDHPTAETIYMRAKNELPSISLGTVYRILKDMAEKGELLEISLIDQSRFDKTLIPHAHLYCSHCGRVVDVMMKEDDEFLNSFYINKLKINKAEIVFNGLCEECC